MIQTLLFRLNNPRLYTVAKALKELRELIHCCLKDEIPGRHRINKTRTRLADIHQKAQKNYCRSTHVRLIDEIQQLLVPVDTAFREIRNYDLGKNKEIFYFFAVYLALLDTLGEAITSSSLKSGEAVTHAGTLIVDGRKLLISYRADIFSRTENMSSNMALITLYTHFETWLSGAKQLSENIHTAKHRKTASYNTHGIFAIFKVMKAK